MRRGLQLACLVLFLEMTLTVAVLGQGPQPRPAGAAQPAAGPPPAAQAPFPPLPPEHQKFLDDVLLAWQKRSQAVERYRCTFKRWEYDPVFGPKSTFKTYSEGVIEYAAPDKGLFKVEKMMDAGPPAQAGGQPKFTQRAGDMMEFWICDGSSVFEHDYKNKRLIQRELPPQMRGKAVADGPLPFLFGADREKILRRYWVRPLPVPEDVKGEYWLEAFPKTRQDAANYQKVHVIIDQADFLPKGLVIFDRNFHARNNPARQTFTFENREINWSVVLDRLNPIKSPFYEPKVPYGWKKVVEKYEAPEADNFAPAATVPPPNPGNQAQRTGTRPAAK